jgi:hypothetical protein
MPTWREIGLVYGGAHIGKAASKAIDMIDPALNAANKKVWERPSFWTTLAISVGVPVFAAFAEKRVRSPTARALLAAGVVAVAAISTKIWDYIEEALATAGAKAAGTATSAPAPAPITYSVSAPARVTVTAPSPAPSPAPAQAMPALPGMGF